MTRCIGCAYTCLNGMFLSKLTLPLMSRTARFYAQTLHSPNSFYVRFLVEHRVYCRQICSAFYRALCFSVDQDGPDDCCLSGAVSGLSRRTSDAPSGGSPDDGRITDPRHLSR